MDLASHLKFLANQKILIWGLGREGHSTLEFLTQFGPSAEISVTDANPSQARDNVAGQFLTEAEAFNQTWDLIFKAPGISPYSQPAAELIANGTEFWSNSRLALQLSKKLKPEWPHTTIGITGTKGKSTTSAILAHVLTELGYPSILGGNIGTPPLTALHQALTAELKDPWLVLELSSHQLLDVTDGPDIAIVQGLMPEHLDYYPDVQTYYAAKKNLVAFLTDQDQVFFNQDIAETQKLVAETTAQLIPFGLEINPELTSWLRQVSPLLGDHNLYNLLPAVLLAGHLGHTQAEIEAAIASFKPLPHRLEPVTNKHGVLYVNDSLSTTPAATIQAVSVFGDRPVILIAGGYERHQDYNELVQVLHHQNIKKVLGLPTTGQRLIEACQKMGIEAELCENLQQAMKIASSLAEPNDVVLLSPGAASFGEFQDYAQRGERFRQLVEAN